VLAGALFVGGYAIALCPEADWKVCPTLLSVLGAVDVAPMYRARADWPIGPLWGKGCPTLLVVDAAQQNVDLVRVPFYP
jgi:hypothetical protein